MSDFAQLESAVITIGPDTPTEVIAEVLNRMSFVKQEAKRIGDLLESQLVERIKATKEDIQIGTVRYYVGQDKKITVRNNAGALQTLFTICGGDMDRFAGCLSSGWLKNGTVRKLTQEMECPEKWDEIFEATEKDELREGKLKSSDSRFLR
jgi:hypothetical protein